jgi:RNA polymerase sigma-70 factor (ECF subfamily)
VLSQRSSPPHRLASVHRLPLGGVDDTSLARAAREGHPGAAAGVWDRFSSMVRGVLRRSLGPGGEIDDLVQVTFLRLFEQIGALRDPEALRSFVFGIALRVARGELRRRRVRRWLRLSDDGVVPEVAREGEDVEAREALARLYAILNRIDDEARLVFVLRHVEGLELTEVAAALEVSLATAKRKLAKVTPRVMALVARDPLLVDYLDRGPAGRPSREEEEG